MTALCTETVDRGHGRWTNYQPCGRPAKEDGLCSLHLKVRDRRRIKDLEFREKMNQADALKDEAQRLSEALGIDVGREYSILIKGGGYTGKMTVPLDWLQTIANERSA